VFANERQDDWVASLPLAEFAYNNSYHSTIGMTPFYSLYGQHPRHQISMTQVKSRITDVDSWLSNIHSIQSSAARHITELHKRHARFANKTRVFDSSAFSVGCQVMLSRRNIHTTRPSRKLDDKLLGPFTIKKLVGPKARKLALPPSMGRLHPVFHVSLLEPYRPSTLSGRHVSQPPPPRVRGLDGEAEYELERILDSKMGRKKGLQYFIQWAGYRPEDNSWIPATETHADNPLVTFHTAYLSKPGYTRAFPQSITSTPATNQDPFHTPSATRPTLCPICLGDRDNNGSLPHLRCSN